MTDHPDEALKPPPPPPPEASLAAAEALLSIQEQLAEIEHHRDA